MECQNGTVHATVILFLHGFLFLFDRLLFKETMFVCRLYDVLHSEKKLTLVFEYCDQDLKKYFDSCNGEIDPDVVKVVCIVRLLLWTNSL